MRLRLLHTAALSLALLLLSCEKEKSDVIDVSLSSPFLSSLQIGTSLINLDTTTGSTVVHLPDGSYKITDTVILTIRDAAGLQDLASVNYYLYRPGESNSFASGLFPIPRPAPGAQLPSALGSPVPLASADTEVTYRVFFFFTISRCDIGAYRIQVIAQNQSNLASNSLSTSVIIGRNNLPPVLSNLSVPDTLHRPTTGRRPVFFAVTASDPDCETDIAKVFFRSVNSTNPNFEFQLFDDGGVSGSGDSVANDGRYSLIIPIDSTATLGTKEFRFWARDKSGALSDSLSHLITILP